jgi:hypothetical protein
MIKIFYAVAVSAIAAACFVALPTLSQQVRANPPAQAVLANPVDARPAPTTSAGRTPGLISMPAVCAAPAACSCNRTMCDWYPRIVV